MKFNDLTGHLLFGVYRSGDVLRLVTTAGEVMLRHHQDCCESVTLSEVSGEGAHPGVTIRLAEERITGGDIGTSPPWGGREDSWTATWYVLRTDGYDVDAHWQGSSNGYYSESVNASVDPLSVEDVEGLPPDARVNLDRWLEAGGALNVVSS